MKINGREIGAEFPPYVIAEISANHNGKLEVAKRLILEAKHAGADAVKLQTYKPDTITLNVDRPEFRITDGLWAGKTLYELYQEAHLPWEWHEPLFKFAKEINLTIFSSPFDSTAVDFLESLDAPAYKIASFELVDTPLIEYVAKRGKPMIISTGMASIEEIEEAVSVAKKFGSGEIALLHCVSAYPALSVDYNLRTMQDMKERFGVDIGLSDHTLSNVTAIASIAMGAVMVEKHFTLDRAGGGPDDSFSLEPAKLMELCDDVRVAWGSLGCVKYDRGQREMQNAVFRRSLYFVRNLRAGEVVTSDSIRSVRPGYGMDPKCMSKIIGLKVKFDVEFGDPVKESLFKD